jgi:hypothetical protein
MAPVVARTRALPVIDSRSEEDILGLQDSTG